MSPFSIRRIMLKVKFNHNAYINGELFAVKDDVKELKEDSARRWEKRGHTILVEEEKPKRTRKSKDKSVKEETKKVDIKEDSKDLEKLDVEDIL